MNMGSAHRFTSKIPVFRKLRQNCPEFWGWPKLKREILIIIQIKTAWRVGLEGKIMHCSRTRRAQLPAICNPAPRNTTGLVPVCTSHPITCTETPHTHTYTEFKIRLTKTYTQNLKWDPHTQNSSWRDGSGIKNTCCSCRGPKFGYQLPSWMVHNYL